VVKKAIYQCCGSVSKKIVKKLLKIWSWDPGSEIRDPEIFIHSLRPSHSFPSPDQSKADPEKTYSGSRGQKSCTPPLYQPSSHPISPPSESDPPTVPPRPPPPSFPHSLPGSKKIAPVARVVSWSRSRAGQGRQVLKCGVKIRIFELVPTTKFHKIVN
jgi:hypothetical protein